MIVACSACSTRFRVADEKIGPRGARIRCSRCGQTFSVAPPAAPVAPPPAPPESPAAPEVSPAAVTGPPVPESPHAPDPTGTEGWPTGALEVAGPGGSDSGSSAGHALQDDPFAAFAALTSGADPAPPPPASMPAGRPFPNSLAVTDLADLERTGAVPVAPLLPPEPYPGADEVPVADDGLALEERTPTAVPVRESAARWDDPDPSQAIEVGPDGFQEVDLARGAARPDPGFDPLDGEGTQTAPIPPPPPPVESQAASGSSAAPSRTPGAAPAAAVPAESTSTTRLQPARLRAAAMNVLSLAALLVVTLGIVVWWKGVGIGGLLRWPGSSGGSVDVGQVSSGVYEGHRGMPVIFVRGVVRTTGGPVDGPVSVRVQLDRGGVPLGTVTAPAGALPTTEELATVSSPDELRSLEQRVEGRAAPRLEPGPGVPFLAVLPLPEGDVGTLRFRVEALPARGR